MKFLRGLKNEHFYIALFALAMPIIAQQFIMAMLSFVDSIIVGGLGTNYIAAVGLSNQYYFIVELWLFGATSGTAIFTAQMWGKNDKKSIAKVLLLCLLVGIGSAGFMAILAGVFPKEIIGLFSKDIKVIAIGSEYLRLSAIACVMLSVTVSISAVLRSMGMVKLPMFVSSIALCINTFLGYSLVYGKFGFPEMGVYGAAIGIIIARFIEMTLLIFFVWKDVPELHLHLLDFKRLKPYFVKEYFSVSLPVIVTELVWSIGVSFYIAAYAFIGTEAMAARLIVLNIEKIGWVIFIGTGNACAVMIGHAIGAGRMDDVKVYTKRFIWLFTIMALIVGALYVISVPIVVQFYDISAETKKLAIYCAYAAAAFLWVRVTNDLLYIGLFRSGGDTKFGMFGDLGSVWLVGVPAAFLAAHVLHLPVYWAYALITMEEVVKLGIAIPRLLSNKWIRDVADKVREV